MKCADCGRELRRDEIALSYKLISRAATKCYCLSCLGRQFRVDEAQLNALIRHFREAGCTLFR